MDIKKKWYNVQFESSCSSTKQFSDFSRNIKKYIKDETGIAFDLVTFNKGHFYFSGFLKNKVNGKHVYFSCPDVRYFPNAWYESLLVRTANDSSDYTGGDNNTCDIASLNYLASKLTY
jgi:hypothetical protein